MVLSSLAPANSWVATAAVAPGATACTGRRISVRYSAPSGRATYLKTASKGWPVGAISVVIQYLSVKPSQPALLTGTTCWRTPGPPEPSRSSMSP